MKSTEMVGALCTRAVLTVVTVVSWFVGLDHHFATHSLWLSDIILVVAFIKIAIIAGGS